MSDFTEKVRAMLDAATPGPWFFEYDEDIPGAREPDRLLIGNTRYTVDVFYDHTHHCGRKNYELIAAAPTLLREACERIKALEKVVESGREIVMSLPDDYHVSTSSVVSNHLLGELYASLSAIDAEEKNKCSPIL